MHACKIVKIFKLKNSNSQQERDQVYIVNRESDLESVYKLRWIKLSLTLIRHTRHNLNTYK